MNAHQKLLEAIGIPIQENYTIIGPHRIHFVVAGSGPPLLLLHGANIGWGAWFPNFQAFAKKFTVYALDLPGSGYSSHIDFRKADLEKDFVETVAQFMVSQNIQNPDIIGHSLGGWIALKLALRGIPLRKIILESSLGFSRYIPWSFKMLAFYPLAKLLSRTAMKPTKENMQKFLKGVMAKSSLLPRELIEYFYENVGRENGTHPFLLLQRLFGPFRLRKELMLLENLSSITSPVLVVSGDQDPLIPLTLMMKTMHGLPKFQHEIFSSTGHVPSLEKSKEFNEKALHFFS